MQLERPTEEIKRLQRCISDLVSVLSLSAIWKGGDPLLVARTLLDALMGMLRLEFAYVRLVDPVGTAPIEMVRAAPTVDLPAHPNELGGLLNQWLGDDPQKWPPLARARIGDGDLSVVPLQLGLNAEVGILIAGSERAHFPAQTDTLLLSVAANQAAIAVKEAWLLGEQKRLADELDRRVAQRTAELAAANDELKTEVIERWRVEAALRARERDYRLIVDSIPALVAILTPAGEVELVNRQVLEYFGRTLEEMKDWGRSDAVHPDDLQCVIETLARSIATGDPYEVEHRLRRFDGAYRWFQAHGLPLRDTHGRILRWYVLLTDIDGRKLAEDVVRANERRLRLNEDSLRDALAHVARSEERWRSIFENSAIGVALANLDGRFFATNPVYQKMLGYSGAELAELSFLDITLEEYREPNLALIEELLEGKRQQFQIEKQYRRKNGSMVWVRNNVSVVPGTERVPRFLMALSEDISERKQAEQKLRESELNLRQLTETIPEMLWSATPSGAVDYCNASLLQYTGFTAEEVMGSGWAKLLHPDDADQTFRVWMSCVASGTPYQTEVRTFHAADRTYRWCMTNARPLLDQQGRILKWHGTVVDMHDWKQAQEALRDTQAELAHATRVMTIGVLTASIAHEVNQPLSGIITNASTCLRMLAADPPNVDGARETARRTIRDGNRAAEVIARLRALFGKNAATSERVDLNEAAREVIALSLSELQKKKVELRTELSDQLPPITGDRVQLQQVILNLVLNASDAMSEVVDRPRELEIRTEPDEGNRVRLTVKDSGVGIEPAAMARLFEPFYTTKSRGMGIGLSVSRSIVESHRGRLWAAPNDGPGATFSFSIPSKSNDTVDAAPVTKRA